MSESSAANPANFVRVVLALLLGVWLTAAAGLLLEGLMRFTAFRVFFVSGLGLAAALYYRGLQRGGLPASFVDFDQPITPRATVHVSAPEGL
jgi:hypothetical protein